MTDPVADGYRVMDGGVQVDSGGVDKLGAACPELPSFFVDVLANIGRECAIRSMLNQV